MRQINTIHTCQSVLRFGAFLLLFLLTKNQAQAQSGCNFKTGQTVNLAVAGATNGANYTQRYLLTDTAGVIVFNQASPSFDGVATGQYFAYVVNFDHTQTPPNLAPGVNVANIGGDCANLSDPPLPVGVCDCNNTTGSISWNAAGANAGFTQVFALTDSAGVILSTHVASPVSGLAQGIYNVYPINYDPAQTPPTLTPGTSVFAIGGDCVQVGEPLGFMVCLCNFADAGLVPGACDDNGTGKTEDDIFTFTLQPTGMSLSGFYVVEYGSQRDTIPHGAAAQVGDGRHFIETWGDSIKISDLACPPCSLDLVVTPPATCSEPDTDGDGKTDAEEGTGDYDNDGLADYEDYDPQGYFFCEGTGEIVTGCTFSVAGPGGVIVVQDGTTGIYEWWTDGTPGTYVMSVTLPPGYVLSPNCLEQTPAYDPTGQPDPVRLGFPEDSICAGQMLSTACTPYYFQFELEPGDPFIFGNNIPLVCPCEVTVSAVSQNCASNQAEWLTSIEVHGGPDNDLSWRRNGDPVQHFTLDCGADTSLVIAGVPADGVNFDTISVFYANQPACSDTVIVQRPQPCPYCTSPPAPDALCTPPATFDVDVVATGVVNWETLTGVPANNVTGTIRITGTGTVVVPNSDLLLNSATAVVFLDGVELIVNNGNLQLTVAGSRFLMNGGALRTFGNFEQTAETVVCITGTTVEIGEEAAGGLFNTTGNVSSSADWQNDGGYRYLHSVCANVTHDYQLQSTGTGAGINGRDVIIESCFEIGDRGEQHATPTQFQQKDGDDSGNWQNSRRMFIFGTDIVLANGNYQNSLDTMTVCGVDVKINVTGSFQVNSGYLVGDSLCVAAEDIIENSAVWSANVSSWYSFQQNAIGQNQPITGTLPATEADSATIAGQCFAQCCTGDACVELLTLTLSQTAPTCTGATANNDGVLALDATTNATRFGVSSLNAGSYDGVNYASATAIAAPDTLLSGIPNAGGTYVVRLFNGSDDCFTDTTVTVAAVACTPPCSIEITSVTASACDPGTNTFSLTVVASYSNPPSGDIDINTSAHGDVTFTQTGSPQTFTLTGLTANGAQDANVSANFVNDVSCGHVILAAYDAPASCACTSVDTSLSAAICDGENYLFGGQTLTQSGTYADTLTAASGCDSIVTLTLTVTPLPDAGEDVALVCQAGVAPTSHDFNQAGTWSVVSQPAGANAQINGTGNATNLSLPGVYVFRLTENGCFDEVALTVPDCSCPPVLCVPVTVTRN